MHPPYETYHEAVRFCAVCWGWPRSSPESTWESLPSTAGEEWRWHSACTRGK
ncbi:hypothetical protein CANTEDRAFT_114014 [Yamadazyma tenuis ATCC 10573]|uniref:Uncharacterized protein n=1 Tax=Candida tenuis (strain ATCC 10573 / BCRC 21748 / CBS 615 / JCM 9827 / NBRC 10315 / NRRL Y-1498 / VKM Y-70) TaxID=590646 RepID=G3B4M2_CANTC|nr:uncharacterized protein CANTEDRAFT_114014 [Yamadazyma tenuis ATCC 10573]EGV63980.1 hypothetical protein CANTEDRAFT_114014 [Yamadazyma tenuis ATCC 10573]